MANSVPFTVCTDSLTFVAYRETMEFYNQLLTSNDTKNASELCSDEFLNKNRMNVVTTLITTSKTLWESANCDACYNDSSNNTFSSETKHFLDSYNKYQNCASTKSSYNKSSVCTDCDSSYQTLNVIYEQIKKATNNKVCFDLDDKVRQLSDEKQIIL